MTATEDAGKKLSDWIDSLAPDATLPFTTHDGVLFLLWVYCHEYGGPLPGAAEHAVDCRPLIDFLCRALGRPADRPAVWARQYDDLRQRTRNFTDLDAGAFALPPDTPDGPPVPSPSQPASPPPAAPAPPPPAGSIPPRATRIPPRSGQSTVPGAPPQSGLF